MRGNVQLSKHIIVVLNCFQFVNIHLWLRYGSGSFARDERKIHESTHLQINTTKGASSSIIKKNYFICKVDQVGF